MLAFLVNVSARPGGEARRGERRRGHGSHRGLMGSHELDLVSATQPPAHVFIARRGHEGWLAHKISDTRNCYCLCAGRRRDSG